MKNVPVGKYRRLRYIGIVPDALTFGSRERLEARPYTVRKKRKDMKTKLDECDEKSQEHRFSKFFYHYRFFILFFSSIYTHRYDV